MERHALMHSVIKPHLCELCGKGFIRKNFLADHVAVHHATKQTAQDCAQCGLTFTRRLSLVRHCLKVRFVIASLNMLDLRLWIHFLVAIRQKILYLVS